VTRRRGAVPLALIAALGGCSLITGPDVSDRLETAQAKWARFGQHDYVYEVVRNCECLPPAGRLVEMTVFGDQVTAARYVDTGAPVETALLPQLPTVLGLFAMVQSAIDQHAALLDVEYDADDGHPRRISVDLDRMLVDDEYSVVSGPIAGILTSPPLARGR
jgi:hypothetical protein